MGLDLKDDNVEMGVKQFKDASCDLIIGLGGGGPKDAAKGIRVRASHPEPLHRYLGLRGAVITDTERRIKCAASLLTWEKHPYHRKLPLARFEI
jgi:alcohol dehydrogenase class IV